MKIAVRDDDLNYFYTPDFIKENIKDIWDICPISMSVIPFLKGEWFKNTNLLEKLGPYNITNDIIEEQLKQNDIYKIGDNTKLVAYIKDLLKNKKVYLTMHGINHINTDSKPPNIYGNFGFRAEFFTEQDLTEKLKNAKQYLENIFEQPIKVFTPPQNLYNYKGLLAIKNNSLHLNAYLPNIKDFYNNIKFIGFSNYFKRINYKIKYYKQGLPFYTYFFYDNLKIIEHIALQPATNLERIYNAINLLYKNYGEKAKLVISTHSYGFNLKMKTVNKTMGEVLLEILQYAQKLNNVKFVDMLNLFEE